MKLSEEELWYSATRAFFQPLREAMRDELTKTPIYSLKDKNSTEKINRQR